MTRDILELRAEVEPGDSGGPLVLDDGTVGGVVFAEARTDQRWATRSRRTPSPNGSRPAIGRTSAVDVGPASVEPPPAR